jgi:hypothetical protein
MKVTDVLAKYRNGDSLTDQELLFLYDKVKELRTVTLEFGDLCHTTFVYFNLVCDNLATFIHNRGLRRMW